MTIEKLINHIIAFFTLFILLLSNSFGQITVGTSTTFSSSNPPPTGYEDGIIIPGGVTLTIDGNIGGGITLIMNSSATITVQAEGHLEVIGGATITSNSNWGGIVVAGTNNIEQFTTFPDPSTTNSTSAFDGQLNSDMASAIIKASHIKKADVGVNSNNGGIVRISANSTFIDCDKAVYIGNYASVSQPNVNACYIMNSTFQWVNNFAGFGFAMITCESVSGVTIGGVLIENIIGGGALCNRGNGIEAANADIVISRGGDVFCVESDGLECENFICNSNSSITRNTFRYLSVAINSSGTSPSGGFPGSDNGTRSLGVKYSDFRDNMVGIAIGGATDCRIYRNNFETSMANISSKFNISSIRECHAQNDIVDIRSQGSRSTNIYDNTFTYDSYKNSPNRGIIHIHFSGDDDWQSFIKYNSFSNTNFHSNVATDNVTGIKISGSNRETHILCNTFTNMGTDVDLAGGTVHSVQSNTDQSGSVKAAGNSFSDFLINRLRFDNRGNSTITYHYAPNVPSPAADKENPVSSGFTAATMNLSLVTATANSEVNGDCEITCERFLTSIKPLYSQVGNMWFRLKPQPANNELKLEFTDPLIIFVKYSIYDLQGKLIVSNQIDNMDNVIINTSNLLNGLYVIRLAAENNQSVTQKLIIQH